MNATTISLIVMYAMAVIIMAICILKDMHRSVLRGCVSLGLAVLSIPLTILLTHNAIDRVTTNLLHMVDLGSIAPLTAALPSLEESAVALVHMVIATEICRLVFFVLLALLTAIGHFVCVAIEKKKPALAKKSKPIGAAIGVAFGLVMIVAVLTPTAGYAAEAPEVIHILGEVEQVTNKGEETMSGDIAALQQGAQQVSDTALFKMVRALGGKAIFRATTTVEIGGVETDLYSEFHVLDAVGNKLAVLTSAPIEEFGDVQYDAIRALADDIEASVLLRTLSAEGLSSLSQAWLAGESFIGIEKPSDGGVVDVALNVVLKRFKDTTKDTVAEDVRKLSPAVASAIKAFNVYSSLQANTPSAPSTPGTPTNPGEQDSSDDTPTEPQAPTTIKDTIAGVVDALGDALEDEETKNLAIEIGIGIIAKELEQQFVTDTTKPSEIPAEGEAPAEGEGSDEDQTPEAVPIITQDEYNEFVSGITDLATSGSFDKPIEELVQDVVDIRDLVGIDLSDEEIQSMIDSFVNSPYFDLFN